MGIYLMPYAVEIDKVKLVFASKNTNLINTIKKTSVFKCYASQDSDKSISTEQALGQIINGEYNNSKISSSYGYALIALVDYLGTNLNSEGRNLILGRSFEGIVRKLSEYDITITPNDLQEPIYDFGLPYDDFPLIGGWKKEELLKLRDSFDQIEIRNEHLDWRNDFFDNDLKGIHLLREGIRFCLNNELDWITFAH